MQRGVGAGRAGACACTVRHTTRTEVCKDQANGEQGEERPEALLVIMYDSVAILAHRELSVSPYASRAYHDEPISRALFKTGKYDGHKIYACRCICSMWPMGDGRHVMQQAGRREW